MRISVVCPTWQCAGYIAGTVEMLLRQERRPEEVVFVDDGSTDGTVDILETSRARFEAGGTSFILVRKEHSGPGATRNAGMAAATGDWIAFLDADDVWYPSKLARVAAAMHAHPDANCIVRWERYRKQDGTTALIKSVSAFHLASPLPPQVFAANHFSTSATTLRRELYTLSGGMDPSLPVSQDYEFWLRLSPSLRLACIEEPLGEYVELATSITARPYWKKVWPLLRIFWRHRGKGGWRLACVRIAKTLLSRQWVYSLRNAVLGRKAHS